MLGTSKIVPLIPVLALPVAFGKLQRPDGVARATDGARLLEQSSIASQHSGNEIWVRIPGYGRRGQDVEQVNVLTTGWHAKERALELRALQRKEEHEAGRTNVFGSQ